MRQTPARLVREYINTIEGIWTVCLCDLDSGAVKSAHLQYTDPSLCRIQMEGEGEGDVQREFTAVNPHWIVFFKSRAILNFARAYPAENKQTNKKNTLSKQGRKRLR